MAYVAKSDHSGSVYLIFSRQTHSVSAGRPFLKRLFLDKAFTSCTSALTCFWQQCPRGEVLIVPWSGRHFSPRHATVSTCSSFLVFSSCRLIVRLAGRAVQVLDSPLALDQMWLRKLTYPQVQTYAIPHITEWFYAGSVILIALLAVFNGECTLFALNYADVLSNHAMT